MSARTAGLNGEVLSMLLRGEPLSSGELYNRSQLADKREQVYGVVWRLKDRKLIQTGDDKRHRLTPAGVALANSPERNADDESASLTGESEKAAVLNEGLSKMARPKPADDSLPQTSASVNLVFDEALDGLLEAVAEIEDTSLRVLAGMVARHRPRHSS